MTLDEEARAAIEAARRREAAGVAPERERPPDPASLPELPASPLEAPPPQEPPVGDRIPDSFLYTPSESFAVWRDIWERDVRFGFSSHRGPVGRLIVLAKRLLAPFVRAPLADHFQRERIFHIVLLRHLERQMEEVRRYLREVRDPYSYVRDWAVPDLVARMDALFGILDRRIDSLEAAAAPEPAAGGPAGEIEALLEALFRGRERVLDLTRGAAARLRPTRPGVELYAPAEGEEAATHLRGLEDGALGGAVEATGFAGWETERLVEACRLLNRKLGEGAALLVAAAAPPVSPRGRSPEAVEAVLTAVGFRKVERVPLPGRTTVPTLPDVPEELTGALREFAARLRDALGAIAARLDETSSAVVARR